jgi:hypothetical protein
MFIKTYTIYKRMKGWSDSTADYMNVLPMPFLDLPLYHGTGESSIFPTGYETACWCLRPLNHAFPPKISRISWNIRSHMSAYRISSNDYSTCYDTVRGRKRPPSGAGGAEEGRYRQVAALWAFVIAARKPTYVKTSWLWDKTVLLSAYWSIEPLLQCYSTACPGLDVKHTERKLYTPSDHGGRLWVFISRDGSGGEQRTQGRRYTYCAAA